MPILKAILSILRSLLIAALLTLLTQVGGAIYLLAKPLGLYLQKKNNHWKGFSLRMAMYFAIYLFLCSIIIPPLALKYNRVPLPRFSAKEIHLKPARHFFWIANRNYVRKELYNIIIDISNNINTKYPGAELYYLDANFPLFHYFPLLPHKSHNDGRRLDISFRYTDQDSHEINVAPGVLGYGYCEKPKTGEEDYPTRCTEKGYRLYSALYHLTKHFQSKEYLFDAAATTYLLKKITQQKAVRKVFIEPHLKIRLGLQGEGKIRFHGCGAVRHDDHIHLEI